jgi:hypothetical protein
MKLLSALTSLALVARTLALAVGGKQIFIERDSDGLQDIVSVCGFSSLFDFDTSFRVIVHS